MLSPYYIGRFPVTPAQWAAVMGDNPSIFKSPDRPVDNVSHEQALAFCQTLTEREHAAGHLSKDASYTLPTAAQWQFACLANAPAPTTEELENFAWNVRTSGRLYNIPAAPIRRMSTQPVGKKQPNPWGIFDMLGNVSEWCQDTWEEFPAATATPAPDYTNRAPGKHRVLKGGCWWADPPACSPYRRHKAPPTRHHNTLGFRTVLTPAPSSPSAP